MNGSRSDEEKDREGTGYPVAALLASDESDVKAFIARWVSDFNRDDIKAFTAGCAPQSPTIDGFPPYAWPSCEAWMAAE